ncbi:Uncharacterised protein [Halioglobus japonicus]|nr:Uncharacterised protein [Halioglobus japonicus]
MKTFTTIPALLINAAVILMLSACAQTVGHFTPTAAKNPDDTVFYIYRPAASNPGLMKPLKYDYPDVLIDGKSIGVLKYNQYLVTELTPGPHTITITGLTTASKGWADRDIEQTIPASQSKQVFMKLEVEYDIDSMNLGEMGAKYIINLLPVESEDAIYQIRNTTAAKN